MAELPQGQWALLRLGTLVPFMVKFRLVSQGSMPCVWENRVVYYKPTMAQVQSPVKLKGRNYVSSSSLDPTFFAGTAATSGRLMV